VQVKGTWKDVYFLNLHLRCAISVLVEIHKFSIRREEDLYKKSLEIDWTNYFSVDKTFAVKGAVFTDVFQHSQYPFLLVKDAIVDTFRDKEGNRPNVQVKGPQVLFDLYINNTNVTISLNTSGVPLFQRGYRQATGEAPLNEVVAAALIRMTGWDKKSDFIDPFCGSGTLLIEAALLSADLPSNLERQHYAFKNFKNFDAEVWEEMYAASTKRISSLPCRIYGSDHNAEMITKTRRNLRGLPVGRFVETSVLEFDEVKNPGNGGIVLTNPPYGERMGTDIEVLYEKLGDWMKQEMKGFDCWMISSSESGFKSLGLRPDKKIRLYNGELECSFRKFSIYQGSKKEKSSGENE
jgi:putative N6-adenine-specific DNA methylase